MIVICSYLSLAELYTFRFVNNDCFSVVNSDKRFKKYLSLTNKICEYNVWNDCVRENVSCLFSSLKQSFKSPDIAFCSYLRYELFHMLDHLSLMKIFHHFAFCTRTCNINSICRFRTRIVYENPVFTEKCTQKFRGVKLDVCNRDRMMLFYSLRLRFYSFDICNPNDDFISINETRKRCCLFLKTCNDQKDICLVFTEILVQIYLNLTKNIYEIFTNKYYHLYYLEFFYDECFSHAYRLMCKFFFYSNPDIYLYIYLHFVPYKNYDSSCFKIINWHYLKHIENKEKIKAKNKKNQ